MNYEYNKEKYQELLLKSVIDRLNNLENKDNNFQTIINKYNLDINKTINTKIKRIDDKIEGLFHKIDQKQNSQYIQTNKRISSLERKLDISVEKLKKIPIMSQEELLSLYNEIKNKVENNTRNLYTESI